MRILSIVLICLVGTSGCASVKGGYSTVPIIFGLFQLPITIDLGRPNKPLSEQERCMLKEIADGTIRGDPRVDAVKKFWHAKGTCTREGKDTGFSPNYFDVFSDLSKDMLVFVAISGGGARAASLGAHTLSLLEMKYNEIAREVVEDHFPPLPLIKRIDAYSTVSGGSIYAYEVATTRAILDRATRLDREKEIPPDTHLGEGQVKELGATIQDKCRFEAPLDKDLDGQVKRFEQEFFHNVMKLSNVRDVGFLSSIWYLSPGNLFLGPLITLTTNWNYQNILAGGLNAAYQLDALRYKDKTGFAILEALDRRGFNRNHLDLYRPQNFKLQQLCPKPRFYFNSTSLETGLPFVFTQSVIHAPGDVERAGSQTVRLDRVEWSVEQNNRHLKKVLADATTLEEINSSPSEFPLASAVMASAAFPIGIAPLELNKYGYNPDAESLYETAEKLHVSDGGVFDNSGLITISNLILHLCASQKCVDGRNPPKVILLAINAETDEYDRFYPNKKAKVESWYNTWVPFKYFDLPFFPIRTDALGASPLGVVHFSNKRRAEESAIRQLMELHNNEEIELYYFPVSFSQLSLSERYPVADSSNLLDRLREIPTNFTLVSDDDTLISEASEVLVTTPQSIGWRVGPDCNKNKKASDVKRLDEAFAFALLQTVGRDELFKSEKGKEFSASWCRGAISQ